MGKGSGGSQPTAKYTSADGMTFDDPNKAADRDRQLQLAAAFGYDRTKPVMGGNSLDMWLAGAPSDIRDSFNQYNNQGLTAADYRSEQRLKDQAAQAQQAEEARKAAVAAGRQAIDTNFNNFNDNYFSGLAKTYSDYYLPQLEDQFKEAQNQLDFKLARQGLVKSDTAEKEKAKLQGKYDLNLAGITNRAQDAARQARETVSSARSQLYSLADTAADPAAVNTQLAAETSRLRAYAPDLTPMGQLFGEYLSPIIQTVGNGIAAEAQGYNGFGTGLFNNSRRNTNYSVNRGG